MARPTAKGLGQLSGKRILVDKANTTVVVAAALATIIVVFAIFASLELVNKIAYQNKVISEREKAVKQLEENVESVEQLNAAYIAFEDALESVIGTNDKNSKIILDALPSKYDFPAFATSLEFIIKSSGLTIDEIAGTDEEVSAEISAINPVSIEIPFEISASGNYENVQKLIAELERSIRPFKISSMNISGEDSNLKIDISGVSYYQPAKELGVTEQVVKSDEEFRLDTTTSNTGSTE